MNTDLSKAKPRSSEDPKTEWDTLLSELPPEPPQTIDRFTRILFKACCAMLVTLAIVILFDRWKTSKPQPVVESMVLTNMPTPPGKFGFPTVSELKKSLEPEQEVQPKAVVKPKPRIVAKKPVTKKKIVKTAKKTTRRARIVSSR